MAGFALLVSSLWLSCPPAGIPGPAKVLPLCPPMMSCPSFVLVLLSLRSSTSVSLRALGTGQRPRLALGSLVPQGWYPNTHQMST